MSVADWFSQLVGGGATFAGPDQGLDFTGQGTVYALGPGIVTSINRNYKFIQGTGQAIVYKLTGGPAAGRYIYLNEAVNVDPSLQVGSTVKKGTVLGTFNSSFPGIETGFASDASGSAYGNPSEGHGGNAPDPQALSFRQFVTTGRSRNFRAGASNANPSLSSLWVQAGGSPSVANIMAAIAMAESGGNVGAVGNDNNGTQDLGLWQINSSHSQFNRQQLLSDPLYNAKAAVSVYKSQGLTAWSTYNNGAYLQYMGNAPAGGYALTRPGGGPADGSSGSGGNSSNGDSSGDITATLTAWTDQSDATYAPSGAQAVGLFSGVPILGQIPIVDDIPNPLDFITGISDGIKGVGDFLKLLGWIINPVNILRMVEFMIGATIMGFGLWAAMQSRGEQQEGFQTSESAISRSGLGRVSKELASNFTPEGRVARVTGKAAGAKKRLPAAPHAERRTALRVRYAREQNVANRRTAARRARSENT